MARRSSKKLTAAEQTATIFRPCPCGSPDEHRHRTIYVWQKSTPALVSQWINPCMAAEVDEYIASLPFDQRPTVRVRVKPSTQLIAMADAIGATRQ